MMMELILSRWASPTRFFKKWTVIRSGVMSLFLKTIRFPENRAIPTQVFPISMVSSMTKLYYKPVTISKIIY
jgi:hypothetical protein